MFGIEYQLGRVLNGQGSAANQQILDVTRAINRL